jgi:hypothetical protein
MSAVATTDAAGPAHADLHLVEAITPSTQQMHDAEQKRWMLWFGVPALVAALFVGVTFGTGDAWWLGLAVSAILADILVLVWLAMTSDTNGLVHDPAVAAGH